MKEEIRNLDTIAKSDWSYGQPLHLGTASEMDFARLAAYIDGEGCIGIYVTSPKQGRGRGAVRLTVVNTDQRLILWIQDTFGGKIRSRANPTRKIHKGQKSPWSDRYDWDVHSQKAVAVLQRCLPYFLVKREQAEIAIKFQSLKRIWGTKGMPEEYRIREQELRSQIRELKGIASHTKPTDSRLAGETGSIN